MLSLTGLEQWWVSMLDVGELPNPDTKNPRRVRSEMLRGRAKIQPAHQIHQPPNSAHSSTTWAVSTNPTAKNGAGYFRHSPKSARLGGCAQADIGNFSNPT